MSSPIAVVEVGPRDGLQSLDAEVDTERKLAMIERLLDAGLSQIEVTSFAHPRMVPRLADAEAVMARLPRRPGVTLRTLVPNRRGAERAIAAGADVLLGLLSASATYSERNQNMTVDQALAQLQEIAELAREAGVRWAAAISMAFASPYEDAIAPDDVLDLVARVAELDPVDVYVADTIGSAQPRQVAALCQSILERWPDLRLGVHLHGADARGLACAASAVYAGAVQVETAILGLGGPVVRSPGTEVVGNLSTEGLLATFAGLGIETGLDPDRVQAAARDVAAILGLPRPAAPPDLADVETLIVKRSPSL